QDALLHRVADPLLDAGDVLARDDAADDVVLEDEALAPREGLDLDGDDAVLTAAAGLLDVATEPGGLALDGLEVAQPQRHLLDLDPELPLQPGQGRLDVEGAVAGEDQLARVRVGGDPQGR